MYAEMAMRSYLRINGAQTYSIDEVFNTIRTALANEGIAFEFVLTQRAVIVHGTVKAYTVTLVTNRGPLDVEYDKQDGKRRIGWQATYRRDP
jgi:hypothetical protein